ncbi:hypothetical protein C2G38_2106393, partial [Gigaspora rosea]
MMNKCLAEPQNRPTAKVLVNMLNRFYNGLNNTSTDLCKQIREIFNNSDKNFQYMIKQIKHNLL